KDFDKNGIITEPAQGDVLAGEQAATTKPKDIVVTAKYNGTELKDNTTVKVYAKDIHYVDSQASFEAALNDATVKNVLIINNADVTVPNKAMRGGVYIEVSSGATLRDYENLGNIQDDTSDNRLLATYGSFVRTGTGDVDNLLFGAKGSGAGLELEKGSFMSFVLSKPQKYWQVHIIGGNATIQQQNKQPFIIKDGMSLSSDVVTGTQGTLKIAAADNSATQPSAKKATLEIQGSGKLIIVVPNTLELMPGALVIADKGKDNFKISGTVTNNAGACDNTTVKGLVGMVDKQLNTVTPDKWLQIDDVTISGNTVYGETLTANITYVVQPDNPIDCEYLWCADDVTISGETSSTLILNDISYIGKKIKVIVWPKIGNVMGTNWRETSTVISEKPDATPDKTKLGDMLKVAAKDAAKVGTIWVQAESEFNAIAHQHYVTKAQVDAYAEAVKAAQAIFDDTKVTQKQVDDARASLISAGEVFMAAGQSQVGVIVTSIELIKAPNKTLYCDNDKLELDGMQCKLTRGDGTILLVDAKDFAKNKITTEPAQGSTIDAWHNLHSHEYKEKPMDIVAKYSDTQLTFSSKVQVCQDSAKHIYSQAELVSALNDDSIACIVLEKNPIEEYEVPKGLKCKDKWVFVNNLTLKEFYRLGTAESATMPNKIFADNKSTLKWTDKNGYALNLLLGTDTTANTTIKVPDDKTKVEITLNGDKKVSEIAIRGNAIIGSYLFKDSTEGFKLDGTILRVQGKVSVNNPSTTTGPEEKDPNANVTEPKNKVPTIKLVNNAKIIVENDSEMELKEGALIIAEQGDANFEVTSAFTNNAGVCDNTTVKGLVGVVDKNLTPLKIAPKPAQKPLVFSSKSTATYGDAALTVAAAGGEATITNAVTYAITTDTDKIAALNGDKLAFSGAGSVTITATKKGNKNFADVTETQVITVAPKVLTITGAKAADRAYDGTTDVVLTNGILEGILNADDVALDTPIGTAIGKDVATGAAVTTHYTLKGAKKANYTIIAQPTGITVNITKAPLTITGAAATAREYNGTMVVALTGTLAGVANGEAADVIALADTPIGTVTKAVGTDLAVTTDYKLTGSGIANYELTQPTGVTVNISKKAAAAALVGITSAKSIEVGKTKLVGDALIDTTIYEYIINSTIAAIDAGDAAWGAALTMTGAELKADFVVTEAVTPHIHIREKVDLTYQEAGVGFDLALNVKVKANQAPLVITSFTATYGDKENTLATTGGTGTGEVTYAITKGDTLATVKSGKLTIAGAGDITIEATKAGNADYNEAKATLDVTIEKKNLTVADTTVPFKEYDGTENVTLLNGTLAGIVNGDTLTLATPIGKADKNVGINIPVTTEYTVTGEKVANYNFTQPTDVNVTIEPKALTVSGTKAPNKVFDGKNDVVLTNGKLEGVINTDDVTLETPTGTVLNAYVEDWVPVTTYYTLGGADKGNYTLTQPTNVIVNITRTPVTITGVTATKIYDGTTAVTLTGTPALDGVIAADKATATLKASYPTAGTVTSADWTGKPVDVTITGKYLLEGNFNSNYLVIQPKVTVTIEKATLNVPTGADAPTASAIKSGTDLRNSIITGTTALLDKKTVLGTWAWKSPATTVTASGKYTAVFTPTTGKDNYKPLEAQIQVDIANQAP
ncbi:MAG: YDG domain-containing protein, partial [Oscillospiraceae bacterium]